MNKQTTFASIWELEEYAKKNGFNTLRFEFTSPFGKTVKAKWLDAYFGFIELDGSDGFVTSKQLIEYGCAYCEFRTIESN